MSKELVDVRLSDLLPDSIARDDNVKNSATAIEAQLREVSAMTDTPCLYANIDKRTSEQLDHLAYGWDASVWRDYWSIELKRSIIKNVVTEKRKRGTLKAVKDAVASLGSAATIKEWWQLEPKGAPHTFTVSATLSSLNGVLDSEMQEDLFTLIDDAKPARSHYTLVIIRDVKGRLGVTGYIRHVSYARICSLC